MAQSGPMEERRVWLQAGAMLFAHGELTVDYIIEQLSDALSNRVAVKDWRPVAAAVDAITDSQPQ
jgi:hypothetical protein